MNWYLKFQSLTESDLIDVIDLMENTTKIDVPLKVELGLELIGEQLINFTSNFKIWLLLIEKKST